MKLPTQADALTRRARKLLSTHMSRAKRDGQVIDYTVADLMALLAENPLCHYCSLPCGWDVSIDHRIPTSRGGRHCFANLAPCCPRCNRVKGMLTASEFVDLRAFLGGLHPAAGMDIERRLLAGGEIYAKGRQTS
jgi:5-methylcytosine-specific restriction endonuclease McrA